MGFNPLVMNSFVWLFIGGGLGTLGRYFLSSVVQGLPLPGAGLFPWPTLVVNVLGGLLMGMIACWINSLSPEPAWPRLLLMTGLLGGFTTFSAFSLENVQLLSQGAWGLSALYSLSSVVLSVSAVAAGMALMRGWG